jgi:hypothetical protein
MKWKNINPRLRLNIIGVLILLVGVGSGFFIYRAALRDSAEALNFEPGSGRPFQIRPEYTKTYRHDMELYGGKANVALDQFMRDFAGLWQGKRLAFTVAGLAIFVSLVIFYIAHQLPSALNSHIPSEKTRDQTD